MKSLHLLYIPLIITGLNACSTTKTQVNHNAKRSSVVDGKLWAALWQQQAAEYKALCFQAYTTARLQLDIALQNNYGKPLAIITDIDETVLDNSPNTVSQGLKGKDYEPGAWFAWTEKANADTISGAASFLKYAASKNVTIFYISNRNEQELEGTLKNLQKFDLPNADAAHLLLKGTTSGKELRRLKVMQNNEVLLYIGDNLADFSSLFDRLPQNQRATVTIQQSGNFGRKFILLPNVMYGDWEGALFRYDYGISVEEKEKIIRKALKGE